MRGLDGENHRIAMVDLSCSAVLVCSLKGYYFFRNIFHTHDRVENEYVSHSFSAIRRTIISYLPALYTLHLLLGQTSRNGRTIYTLERTMSDN